MLGVLPMAGCILLIDDAPQEALGDHCRFDGDADTACGRCVAKACRAQVDACCDDEAGCSPQLPRLDACASDPQQTTCAHLTEFNTNAPPGSAALNACVEKSCADACPVKKTHVCTGRPKDECFECCLAAFPRGEQVALALDRLCACSPGACAPLCETSAYCVTEGPFPSDACIGCLAEEGIFGGACVFAEGCSEDADCLAFTTCFGACYG